MPNAAAPPDGPPEPDGPRPPQHRPVKLPALRTGSPAEIYDGDTVAGERLVGADFAGRDLRQTSFTDCELTRCRFDDADLTGVHLVTSVLSELDVTALDAPRCELRSVEIGGSRLGAVVAYESNWRSVVISDSKIGYLNARAARWRDVTFRDCVITELDLAGARIERMAFERCRIDELHLGGDARLDQVDLRQAELAAIDGLAGLAGCTISGLQLDLLAPLLAAHLGIDVR